MKKLVGVIHSILNSPYYIKLNIPGNCIRSTQVQAIRISEEEDKSQDGQSVSVARIHFQVKFTELVERITPDQLREACTNVEINDSGIGLQYKVII